jgi:asparagine synthetase B (glutamine-hydrolysing)
MSTIRVLGSLDRNVAWDGTRLYREPDFQVAAPLPYQLRGAAASVQPASDGAWRILRDPLGLNKLFWAQADDGLLDMAALPRTLVDAGHSFDAISAIPRGCVIDLSPGPDEPAHDSIIPNAWFSSNGSATLGVEEAGREIRSRLDRYLAAIAAAYPSATMFVCLSGGLDSSGIATLARHHFPGMVAVSFDLSRPGKRASQDRIIADRLARDLGMPLLEANVNEAELFAHLDTVLVAGADWRDFNVHAALVNAALAVAIEGAAGTGDATEPAFVLTGDLANEFLVDYHPEQYKGATFYGLPRLPAAALRTSLVRGLDTSHREVGVFGAWGLSVVQPYAVAADNYLALDPELLRHEDRKQRLCREIFGDLVPEYVYSRPKTRAQVGDQDMGGGVLAACVDRGFDDNWLRLRFAGLHGVAELGSLDRFIRAGRYRTGIPALTSEAL